MEDFIMGEKEILKKYVGPGGDVVIPSNVTRIGGDAFSNCRSRFKLTALN